MWNLLLFALAQSSTMAAPLHLGESAPPTRAVAALRIADREGESGSARREVQALLAELRSPEDFTALAKSLAGKRTATRTAMYGVVPPGLLAAQLDQRLASLAVGEIGAPFEHQGAQWIVQRIEDSAACRQIFIAGVDAAARERAERVVATARGGADFAQLARENSDERASALRGGDFAIFERGPADAGLRAATFAARIGEIVGPLETPLGFHIVQRVGVDSLDPRLRDDNWARVRCILVAFRGAPNSGLEVERRHDEAQALADDLALRIRRGEDMAQLAREHTDDRGLREFGGEVGWVRRGVTRMPPLFDRVFVEPAGQLIGPLPSTAGFVLLRREDPGPRTRLDLRVERFADLVLSLRASAERVDVTTRSEALSAALEALRALAPQDGAPTWRIAEELLGRSASSDDFAALLEARCPSTSGEASGELSGQAWCAPLRAFAAALTRLEAEHLELVWLAHQRHAEAALTELRVEWNRLGASALEALLAALESDDPRVVVQVRYVADGPSPGAGLWPAAGVPQVWVDVDATSSPMLLERTLVLVARALLARRPEAFGLRASLHEACAAATAPISNASVLAAEHALLDAAVEHVVQRVFERSTTLGGAGALESALRAVWSDYFRASVTRSQALERVVAELAARR
jgi:parvulin-like peptidyl-prolyl isomerase